jgi:hypothetical protein
VFHAWRDEPLTKSIVHSDGREVWCSPQEKARVKKDAFERISYRGWDIKQHPKNIFPEPVKGTLKPERFVIKQVTHIRKGLVIHARKTAFKVITQLFQFIIHNY